MCTALANPDKKLNVRALLKGEGWLAVDARVACGSNISNASLVSVCKSVPLMSTTLSSVSFSYSEAAANMASSLLVQPIFDDVVTMVRWIFFAKMSEARWEKQRGVVAVHWFAWGEDFINAGLRGRRSGRSDGSGRIQGGHRPFAGDESSLYHQHQHHHINANHWVDILLLHLDAPRMVRNDVSRDNTSNSARKSCPSKAKSCSECRRLKLRCICTNGAGSWPCSNCIRRGCQVSTHANIKPRMICSHMAI